MSKNDPSFEQYSRKIYRTALLVSMHLGGEGSPEFERGTAPGNLLFLQAGMKRLWREKKNCNTNRESGAAKCSSVARDEKKKEKRGTQCPPPRIIGKNWEFPRRLVSRMFPYSSQHSDLA